MGVLIRWLQTRVCIGLEASWISWRLGIGWGNQQGVMSLKARTLGCLLQLLTQLSHQRVCLCCCGCVLCSS